MVDPRFAGIVDCADDVDVVVRWKPSWRDVPRFSERFAAALDLQGLLKSALPILFARADAKLAYHWQREGSRLIAAPVRPDPTSHHIVDQYVDVARAAGGRAEAATFRLTPKPEDLNHVDALTEGRAFVALNPGAGWATKRWPPTSFSALIDALAEDGVSCALLGSNAEADHAAAHEVIGGCRAQPLVLTGKTNVRQLVALLARAKAHVGGDTGSTHLAAALGTPAIGLYSITRLKRSCPYGQIQRCHEDPSGLDRISVEAVLGSVREALQ